MVSVSRMGRMKLDRERWTITLPKGMGQALAEEAKKEGWDRSQLIEELARAYLKKREKERGEKT